MTVAPLVWLLIFDFVVALVWWGATMIGMIIHPNLEKLMIALVIIINVVVVIFWLLGMIGWAPNLMAGPFHR